MTAWPDPTRPGVPLNPGERGWHLISGSATEWWGEWWSMDGAVYPNESFSGLAYQGPLYTQREVDDLERAHRKILLKALEAAERKIVDLYDGIAPFARGENGNNFADADETLVEMRLAMRAIRSVEQGRGK